MGAFDQFDQGARVKIEAGMVVSLEYHLHFGDGEVMEGTEPGQPVAFLAGRGELLPGLERALEGRSDGEAFSLVLPPEEAFGQPDPTGLQEVPRGEFPPDLDPQAGMQLTAEDEQGNPIPYTIREVRPDVLVVDFNHPLAGKTLHVDAKVVSVRAATAEELEHGHAHSPGAHHHHG